MDFGKTKDRAHRQCACYTRRSQESPNLAGQYMYMIANRAPTASMLMTLTATCSVIMNNGNNALAESRDERIRNTQELCFSIVLYIYSRLGTEQSAIWPLHTPQLLEVLKHQKQYQCLVFFIDFSTLREMNKESSIFYIPTVWLVFVRKVLIVAI